MEPRAGGSSGFALAYYDSTGAVVAVGGSSRRIARIDVALRTIGQAGSDARAGGVVDSVKLGVALRNRR
jgi:hypothetical protein